MRKITEIEEEMEEVAKTGNIGKMMDLVDEYGNTFEKMHAAIADGDLDRITELEQFDMDITDAQFSNSAVISNQLLVIVHQVNKGADIDQIIQFSKPTDKPLKIGRVSFSGNHLIHKWATSWKTVNVLNKKLPLKGNKTEKQKKYNFVAR